MLEKLRELALRYEDLQAQLADPTVYGDADRLRTVNRELKELAGERGCAVLGTFGCKGYDTFGPFKLVGGLAKGRPDEGDLDRARSFFRDILTRL